MKKLRFLILFIPVLASCSSNPDDLASEYCNCRADIDKGLKSEADCASLAESHTLKLQDDTELMKRYTSKVLDCVTSTEIPRK